MLVMGHSFHKKELHPTKTTRNRTAVNAWQNLQQMEVLHITILNPLHDTLSPSISKICQHSRNCAGKSSPPQDHTLLGKGADVLARKRFLGA